MLLYETAIISGVFAGVIAVAITRLIEILGGIVGGVLGTLPTTIVMATIGFWSTLSTSEFRSAMYIVPLGMLIDGGVLACWRYIPELLTSRTNMAHRGVFACTLTVSLLFWSALAGASYALVEYGIAGNVNATLYIGIGALFFVIVLGLVLSAYGRGAPKGSRPVTWVVLGIRGIGAGAVIFGTVYLGTTSSIAAGLFSTFPIIFTTTVM